MKAMMKPILLIFSVSLLITSCGDYLNVVPDNVATLDNAFSDQYTAEKYLFTCYSYLPGFGNSWQNPALLSGDEIWYPERLKFHDGHRIARGEQNISSPIFDFWSGNSSGKALYKGIRACNTFLEEIHGVMDLPDYERDRWIAEVKFLKAYYHFYLTRMYGPVYIADKNMPVSSSTEMIKVERLHVDSCFSYVETLMDEAIEELPLQIENVSTELGRITKPIAAAVKARVLVTAASPLFNGNPDMAALTGIDNEALFSKDHDVKKWEKAAVACGEAIDICDEAGLGLYQKEDYIPSYEYNDSITMKMFLRSRISERWNRELIWSATTSLVQGGGHWQGSGLQFEAQPRLFPSKGNPVGSRHAPTLRMAELYYSKNGVPIEEDLDWEYANRYGLKTASADHRYYLGAGEETASLHFDREYRFYADLTHDRALWFGNGKVADDEDSWLIESRKGEFSSVFEVYLYSVTGYLPKKLIHLESEIKNEWYYATSYAFPIMRMADLYLNYAESLNEMKAAPDEEVYEYIDRVRERAGLKGVVESWEAYSSNPSKATTKAGMRKIIQHERMIEMAFEGARFWDLRRWKLAHQYMNKPIRGWSVLEQDVKGYYSVNTLFNQRFELRDYFWPIPENEIILNPRLVQNPGW